MSAAVSALTRDVGVALLERQGRGLRLTASGKTYAEYARTILGLHVEALAAARGEADPASGQVRLAAVTTAGEHVLPVVLASFRAEHPRHRTGPRGGNPGARVDAISQSIVLGANVQLNNLTFTGHDSVVADHGSSAHHDS